MITLDGVGTFRAVRYYCVSCIIMHLCYPNPDTCCMLCAVLLPPAVWPRCGMLVLMATSTV